MDNSKQPIFTYTGHPLVDVGASVIAAFGRRRSVEQVTEDDLKAIAAYIKQHYVRDPLRSFLTTVFPNSAYANPTIGEARRDEVLSDVLGTSRATEDLSEDCPFCGRPAKRRFRQHIPLITGEGVVNFTPQAAAGLPICAYCLLAVQACVLGSRRCQGRMLLAHSDDPQLTLQIADGFLNRNRNLLNMEAGTRYPNSSYPGTILIDALIDALAAVQAQQAGAGTRTPHASLTAYHITNYGTSADADIYHLPSELLDFIAKTGSPPPVRNGWQYAVRRGWRMGLQTQKGKQAEEPAEYTAGEHRNQLYEDLFGLAANRDIPGRFVRRHLGWRTPDAMARAPAQADAPDAWPLTELFLRKVLLMEKARVEVLRTLGERLAGYVVEQNDKRLFDRLWRESGTYYRLRNHLLRASHAQIRRGEAPLISFDEFLLAFEEGEEIARADWSLARDLLLIKMMDELYARGWLQQHAADLEEVTEEETEDVG